MKFLLFATLAAATPLSGLSVDDGNHADGLASLFRDDVVQTQQQQQPHFPSWLSDHRGDDDDTFDDESAQLATSYLPQDDLEIDSTKKKFFNLTIYQLLSASNHTTEFVSLVDQFPSVVALLNDSSVDHDNYTLFVPTDAAFAKLPGGALNETDPVVLEALVRHHIGLGAFPYSRIFATRTIPTAHNESLLGDHPQRLRTRFEKGGLRVNFYSHVKGSSVLAKNGAIYPVDTIIVPPTFVGAQLVKIPFRYSTYLMAMQKTGFVQYIHALKMNGSTVLAPTNAAFDQLPPSLNAFLFNTPKGLQYLKALLKFNIVVNATVYSDFAYGAIGNETAPVDSPVSRLHYVLPTLLDNATVLLNVTRFPGFVHMTVGTAAIRVSVQDGVAKNGVIQEVPRLVFPPLPLPNATEPDTGIVRTVADVVARLGPYVEGKEEEASTYVNILDVDEVESDEPLFPEEYMEL